MGLSACGSIPTQTIQTTHLDFSIPSYWQQTADNERQDHSADKTGSLLIEYTTIPSDSSFEKFIQANSDTLRQNLGTQLQDDITKSTIQITCSGDMLTGGMLSFAVHQDEDVLYLSQIFTIHDTDITAISIASFTSDTRSETTNSITDSIACKI